MYSSLSSQSALLTMTASVGPSPNLRKFVKPLRMPAMFLAICSSPISLRDSSRNEGSPILVVPPPISTMGLCPACCSRRNSMMPTMLPTCRLSAVASKPI